MLVVAGQHEVGVVRGVGQDLLVHDREEVLAREALAARGSSSGRPRPGSSCTRRAPSPAARGPDR